MSDHLEPGRWLTFEQIERAAVALGGAIACLEDENPDVGDNHAYDIAHLSYLIMRTAPTLMQSLSSGTSGTGWKPGSARRRGPSRLSNRTVRPVDPDQAP